VAITAIAEVSEATRRTVPGVGAAVYPGIAEMLDSEALDGVLIVVPTDRHLQVITEVAARALPILCEKPCGLTVAQTRAAVTATEAAGVRERAQLAALRLQAEGFAGFASGGPCTGATGADAIAALDAATRAGAAIPALSASP